MARGLLTLCTSAFLAAAKAVQPADVVFHNGSIYTMSPKNTMVTAMAVRDGKIEYVGNKKTVHSYIGNSTKVIDLEGRMAMPGLVDSHMHLISGGLFLLKCDLSYQTLPIEKVLEHIQGCLDDETDKGDDAWMEVVNMDYAGLVSKSGNVGKAQLDKLSTKRPIIVRSSDYHTILANSRALDLSGIDASTKDPPDGKIVRLPRSQEPAGALQDGASNLLAGPPPPTDEENLEAGRAALKLLREAGITTFQDAAALEDHHTVFSAIKEEDGLSARAYFDYRIEAPKSIDDVPALVNSVIKRLTSWNDDSTISPKPTLKWQAIKAFIDGVITYPSNTAALIDPYWAPVNSSNENGTWAPDKNSLNDPYWKPAILTKTLELLFLAGIDAQFHTDGDLAVRVGLDAAEAFRKKHPAKKDFRLGLAHDELSHQKDWSRFAKLGVDPIVSYQWSQLSSFYIPNTFNALGEYRMDNLQAWAQFEKRGRPLVYGSDWPIDPLDEFLALKVAVTRSGDPENPNSPASQGPPFDGVFPGSGISRTSALRSITINGARFLRADKEIGSLEKDKIADIIVLENNFFKVPEEALGRQKVLLTMVGGEVLYVAKGHDFGVKAKFPNDDKASSKLARRTIGGFNANELSEDAKADAAKLRKRGACVHKH